MKRRRRIEVPECWMGRRKEKKNENKERLTQFEPNRKKAQEIREDQIKSRKAEREGI